MSHVPGIYIVLEGAWAVEDRPRLVLGPYSRTGMTGTVTGAGASPDYITADGERIAWRSAAGAWVTRFSILNEDAHARRWPGSEQTAHLLAFRSFRFATGAPAPAEVQ